MSREIITGEYRDINTITQAFRITLAQAQRMALSYVIQLGQLITEAKELLDDNAEFERWLAEEVNFKKSTAYNYIKIAAEYGGKQVNMFGDAESSKLGSLSYSQALALLAVPAEEREEFANANNIEEMSARELKKAIAERDAALKAKEEAEREKEEAEAEKEAAEEALEAEKAAKPDVSGIEKRAQTAEENSKRLEKSLEEAKKYAEKVQNQLKEKTDEQVKLAAELKKLRENPEIPEKMLAAATAEAEEKAKNEAETRFGQRIELLEAQLSAATSSADKLKKQLQQSNEEVTIFRTYLTDIQTTLNKLSGLVLKVEGRDAELAKKLKAAEKSVLSAFVEKL